MENTINERFKYVVENYIKGILGVNKGDLASLLGLKPSLFSEILNNRTNLSLETASKFLLMYPMIDTMWLLVGKGEMLKTIENSNLASDSIKDKLIARQDQFIDELQNKNKALEKEIEHLKKVQKPTIYSQMVAESHEKLIQEPSIKKRNL